MKHLTARDAARFLEENPAAVFIDCRSEMEYFFVGHPVGAHHVAWNDGPDWDVNPHFVGQVKKVASMNRKISGSAAVKKTAAGLRQNTFWSKRNWWSTIDTPLTRAPPRYDPPHR